MRNYKRNRLVLKKPVNFETDFSYFQYCKTHFIIEYKTDRSIATLKNTTTIQYETIKYGFYGTYLED